MTGTPTQIFVIYERLPGFEEHRYVAVRTTITVDPALPQRPGPFPWVPQVVAFVVDPEGCSSETLADARDWCVRNGAKRVWVEPDEVDRSVVAEIWL